MNMTVNVILDIVLCLIMLIGLIVGLKKGFFAALGKPIKFFIALFLAFQFAAVLSTAIIEPMISAPITNKISSFLMEKYADMSAETTESLPTLIKLAAGLCGVDLSAVAEGAEGGEIIVSIVNAITTPAVRIVCTVFSFIVLFFLSKLVLALIFGIVNKIIDNGFVGVVNKILGCVFTGAVAFIACWGISSIFEFVIHLDAFAGQAWVNEFTGGFVYNFFKSISPLDLLLSF